MEALFVMTATSSSAVMDANKNIKLAQGSYTYNLILVDSLDQTWKIINKSKFFSVKEIVLFSSG